MCYQYHPHKPGDCSFLPKWIQVKWLPWKLLLKIHLLSTNPYDVLWLPIEPSFYHQIWRRTQYDREFACIQVSIPCSELRERCQNPLSGQVLDQSLLSIDCHHFPYLGKSFLDSLGNTHTKLYHWYSGHGGLVHMCILHMFLINIQIFANPFPSWLVEYSYR